MITGENNEELTTSVQEIEPGMAAASMTRTEKRKAAKREKRKQKRKELAEKVREEEEARLNDPEEQRRIQLEEDRENERLERERREFEERERRFLEAFARQRAQEEAEEEERRKAREEEEKSEKDQAGSASQRNEDDDWEYVEDGPPEIIWQGNEIIVKKNKVRVNKKGAIQHATSEDLKRPTSNPLPPQSEVFAEYRSATVLSAQQLLEDVAQQIPNFGTEQDKAHCPFHLKTGACRFGSRCSRVHFYPDKSCTLMMKNLYNGPGLAWEQDEGLEYTDEEVEHSYEDFYEDVHTEFLKFGEILNFKVCRNGSFHLRGNVYVHYKSLDSAVLAYNCINGRYFAGKQVTCEFVGVTRWKVAICGEFMKSKLKTCSRGTACNFIHCFRNPGGDYEWADWDKPPPKYWVKKMAALFGYPDESVYDREIDKENPGSPRKLSKTLTTDRDRSRKSQSRDMGKPNRKPREHGHRKDEHRHRHSHDNRRHSEILDDRQCEGKKVSRNHKQTRHRHHDDADRDKVRDNQNHSSRRRPRYDQMERSESQDSQGDSKSQTSDGDSDAGFPHRGRARDILSERDRKTSRYTHKAAGVVECTDASGYSLGDNHSSRMEILVTENNEIESWDEHRSPVEKRKNTKSVGQRRFISYEADSRSDSNRDTDKLVYQEAKEECSDNPKKARRKLKSKENFDSNGLAEYKEQSRSPDSACIDEDIDKRGRWDPAKIVNKNSENSSQHIEEPKSHNADDYRNGGKSRSSDRSRGNSRSRKHRRSTSSEEMNSDEKLNDFEKKDKCREFTSRKHGRHKY